MARRERGIHEFFARDPERADWETWHRVSNHKSRRGFLHGLGATAAALGMQIAFSEYMPRGLIPVVYANSSRSFVIEGKDGLVLLNDRPLNAETRPHLLNDDITPTNRLFIRNNGIPPNAVDSIRWTLNIGGESVIRPRQYTLPELKKKFEHISRQITLECGGNGRAEFDPPASGNQWTLGAVGCPVWNGMRLRDLLLDVGLKDDAVFVAYHGEDRHASGDRTREAISRGVHVSKAMDPDSMLVWGMNGTDLHPMNGHPLRLVFGGQPGSTSGKWLSGLSIRDRVHDGPKMAPPSYHVPCEPVVRGSQVSNDAMCMLDLMPVKSLITNPESGIEHPSNQALPIHGHAWTNAKDITAVHLSIDYGTTWTKTELQPPVNRFAWQHFDHSVRFPKRGYYEVWARAVDSNGESQPMLVPGWNPKGYGNNACHRIAVHVV
ncbi:MAG: sulfite oxidase [Gammaproteobacteria bacterium]|nr:sulfite oxidase [Gammaproteobacteria bacterium]